VLIFVQVKTNVYDTCVKKCRPLIEIKFLVYGSYDVSISLGIQIFSQHL
jgi:hypothetical protein